MATGSREPFYVTQQTRVLLNDQPAQLANLPPGAIAEVSVQQLDGIRHVRQIAARGQGQALQGQPVRGQPGQRQPPAKDDQAGKQPPGGGQPPGGQPPQGGQQPPAEGRAADAIVGRILRNKGDLLILLAQQGECFVVMSQSSREPLIHDQGTRYQVDGRDAAFKDLRPGADAMVLYELAATNIRRVVAVSASGGQAQPLPGQQLPGGAAGTPPRP